MSATPVSAEQPGALPPSPGKNDAAAAAAGLATTNATSAVAATASPGSSAAQVAPPTPPNSAFAATASPSSAQPPQTLAIGTRLPCRSRRQVDQQRLCEVIETRERNGITEYYIHYVGLNKRLDEWVEVERLVTSQIIPANAVLPADPLHLLEATTAGRKITRNMKRKLDAINNVEQHSSDFGDTALAALEKQHEEVTKVKNIQEIQFGEYEIETWYFAPYPDEFARQEKLYICEFCCKYMKKRKTMVRHAARCAVRHPPGHEIYRSGNVSFFEVDGTKNKIYCQNLCLLAKLFLDHKTLYFDVEPFRFYVLTENDDRGSHIVGYFSKEKQSHEGYNLACILTLPPYQRRGFGRLMIEFSYELSRREGKDGSPEKPLSDLGKLSFRSYWTYKVLRILETTGAGLSVKDISRLSGIWEEDIVTTLTELELIKYIRGQHVISVTPQAVAEHLATLRRPRIEIDSSRVAWIPPAERQAAPST